MLKIYEKQGHLIIATTDTGDACKLRYLMNSYGPFVPYVGPIDDIIDKLERVKDGLQNVPGE